MRQLRQAVRRSCTSSACVAALSFALSFAIAQTPADAPKLQEIKVSTAVGPTLPLGKAAERWTALLNESESKRHVAKLHPGAMLAERDPARELLALKEGKADLAVGSSLQWSMQVPALAVYSLPWIAPRSELLALLASDEALRAAIATKLEAHGVFLVAVAPLGFREVATRAQAIRSVADLDGLKLRAAASPLLHDVLLALKAQPQSMPFTQAQAAFARGALDGQEGPPSALAAARAHASGLKHLTDWGAIGEVMMFAVRKAVWDAWSDSERESARRAALRAIGETDALAREAEAMRQLAKNGMAVVRMTSAGHAAFRAAVSEADARWRSAIGEDVVDLAQKALASQSTPAAPTKRP